MMHFAKELRFPHPWVWACAVAMNEYAAGGSGNENCQLDKTGLDSWVKTLGKTLQPRPSLEAHNSGRFTDQIVISRSLTKLPDTITTSHVQCRSQYDGKDQLCFATF